MISKSINIKSYGKMPICSLQYLTLGAGTAFVRLSAIFFFFKKKSKIYSAVLDRSPHA